MTKRKTAGELTTEGAMRRLFPKEVRQIARDEIKKADEKSGGSDEEKGMILYVLMSPKDTCDDAAKQLASLINLAVEKTPGKPRLLFIDIEGHKNKKGGWDAEAWDFIYTVVVEGTVSNGLVTEATFSIGPRSYNLTKPADVPQRDAKVDYLVSEDEVFVALEE